MEWDGMGWDGMGSGVSSGVGVRKRAGALLCSYLVVQPLV